MSSVKTVQITTKELNKDDSNNLNDLLSPPSKIQTTNTSQTFTTKSNSKFVDFIWSKFTKPKHATKEKDTSNQNDEASEKKRKRSIFNLFDSSKTKNNSGAKTNSNKSSKSNLEDKHVYDNNITSNTVDEFFKLTGNNLNSTLLIPENKKPALIDNSMVKSKIQAARNSRKPRNVFPSKSNSSVSQSMEKIEEIPDPDARDFICKERIKIVEENAIESNSNKESIKSQLISGKASNTSQELITSSTNFTSSSASSDIFEKTERLNKELTHRNSKNNLALNSATSFSNSNYKSITSMDKVGIRNASNSPSTDSNDKSNAWITKDQINSTSSLITNLFENQEENFDLFGGSNGFSSNSKSFIEMSPKEISKDSKQMEVNNRNSNSDVSKKESLEKDKATNRSSNKLDENSKKKLVIYDNNLLDQNLKSEEMQENFKKLRQKFHTQLSVQLQTRKVEEFSKSKSCERIDKIDDEPSTKSNVVSKKEFLIKINQNINDDKTKEIDLETSANKETATNGIKRLSYSKSLKLTQNSLFIPKNDLNSSKINTNETYSTRIMGGDNNRAPTKIPNEPSWKELAFKKQNAWNKKNLEQSMSVADAMK